MKLFASLIIFFALLINPALTFAQTDIVLDIYFPVEGEVHYSNDFDSPRGSTTHRATDIMAPKMTRVFAAQDGVISFMPMVEPSWGYGIFIRGDDGYKYNYIHLNNDTPGTDDGNGGVEYAYAPGLRRGSRVMRGQHIGWVGDSGNAESTGSHLHFEIEDPDGNRVNPYLSLKKAQARLESVERKWNYNPDFEREEALSINTTLNIQPSVGETMCASGNLIKIENHDAVYYCGVDGYRYAFPNIQVYNTWYPDFSTVKTIPIQQFGEIPNGGMVPYKPGTKLIKSTVSPRVYAIEGGAILRQIPSPDVAEQIFGEDWEQLVHDLHDVFFSTYKVGTPIDEVLS